MKLRKNEKGFTLIELLAVIVILGILMIIAIPAVTKYIERSRKDAYADTAKAYINSARYSILNEEYANCPVLPAAGSAVYIQLKYVDIDQGGANSPYSQPVDKENSYVEIKAEGDETTDKHGTTKYIYSVAIRDALNNGIDLTEEDQIDRTVVQKNTLTAVKAMGEGTKCTKPIKDEPGSLDGE